MNAEEHTHSMLDWWTGAGIDRADLAVRRHNGSMIWQACVPLVELPLAWARFENAKHGDVYLRPARGSDWPIVFVDDVDVEQAARRVAPRMP